MQESRPYLKFNFTACTTSPYPLGPFLKLGNGMVWFWSYFYTFLPCNQQFRPPKRWASWFVWKCENENEDDMDKNGLPWEQNDYVKWNICVQLLQLTLTIYSLDPWPMTPFPHRLSQYDSIIPTQWCRIPSIFTYLFYIIWHRFYILSYILLSIYPLDLQSVYTF